MSEKVTFIQGHGQPSSMWGHGDKAIFSFVRRQLTTDDQRLIKKLDKLGYERMETRQSWESFALNALEFAKIEGAGVLISRLKKAGLKLMPLDDEKYISPVSRNVIGTSTAAPPVTSTGDGTSRLDEIIGEPGK